MRNPSTSLKQRHRSLGRTFACYSSGSIGRDDRTSTRHERAEARASSTSPYDELLKHDKVKLDIFWLKDDTLEDSADLPDPDVLVKIM